MRGPPAARSAGAHARALSLVEKYDCLSHPRKYALFPEIVGAAVSGDIMKDDSGRPDLLVYAPDKSDWFFCEVKGATDTLKRHQIARFADLFAFTKKRVVVLNFKVAASE